MDWFDLLAVQGTLKNFLQHHSSKASIFLALSFLAVTFINDYWKNHIWAFIGEVMSLLFNRLSRFVISFLPRNKHILISWLRSPSAVNLELKKIKSVLVSIVSPSICQEMIGMDAMRLVF